MQVDGPTEASPKVSNKRPPSPVAHPSSSSSKKRLLHDESQNKPGGVLYISTPRIPRVQTVLNGPNSPARKLDFATTLPSGNSSEKMVIDDEQLQLRTYDSSDGSDGNLLPSLGPDIRPLSSSRPPLAQTIHTLPTLSSSASVDLEMADHVHYETTTIASGAMCEAVPREVSPVDRSSVHYPGFDIYQDSCNYVCTAPPHLSSSSSSVIDADEEDPNKENEHPEPYLGDVAWAKAGLCCPREVDLSSPGKTLPERRSGTNLETLLAQRQIRDIGNIREGFLSGGGHSSLAVMSGTLALLGRTRKGIEPTKARCRTEEERGEDGMDIENENGKKNEV